MPISIDTTVRTWLPTRYHGGSAGTDIPGGAIAPRPSLPASEQKLSLNHNEQTSPSVSKTGRIECQECKNRTYQDGSNDPGVSFKSAAHIDPDNSMAVVMSHEKEHVKNETAKAAAENREVISQSVSLETSICPECGRVYTSGGKTRTVTASKSADTNLVAAYNTTNPSPSPRTISLRA